ncbi:MAG TPA: molybdopterin-dependent oxidoreductase, partial [Ktedonobacterales bacterium]|nr:molybdopterin-dependent oxidoreductase [Ktedonobacterales bacterium]
MNTTFKSLMPRVRFVAQARLSLLRGSPIPLVAGALGSLAAILVMGILRLTWGVPSLPELVGERILPQLTVGQFVNLLTQFSPNSKTGPLSLALLGQFVLGVLLGPAYAFAADAVGVREGRWPSRRAWRVIAIGVACEEVVATALFWPVLFANLYGLPIAQGRLVTSFATLIIFAVFILVTALANHWLWRAWGPFVAGRSGARATVEDGETAQLTRRQALVALGGVVLGLGLGAVAVQRLLAAYLARSTVYDGMKSPYLASQATQITPNDKFYLVTKNVLDPSVEVGRWQLEVTGLVHTPRPFDYEQVRALPSVTRAITLECISNGVGGTLMSTALWQGISLQQLLREVGGALPTATRVIFYSVDGFTSSLPLADLLEARALLAYEMNGVPLPDRHGYPLRVVTAGRYGEQSPKWLTRIELVDHDYKGFYQSQGWSDRQVFTTSRIEQPLANSTVSTGPQILRGLAYAGIRGVQKVEVSTDSGST